MPASLATKLFSVTRYYVYGDETRFCISCTYIHTHLAYVCMCISYTYIQLLWSSIWAPYQLCIRQGNAPTHSAPIKCLACEQHFIRPFHHLKCNIKHRSCDDYVARMFCQSVVRSLVFPLVVRMQTKKVSHQSYSLSSSKLPTKHLHPLTSVLKQVPKGDVGARMSSNHRPISVNFRQMNP